MAIPYGRYPKRTAKRTRKQPPGRIRADLGACRDLEDFSFAFQTLVARLQDLGVSGVGNCSLYFTPLDGNGARMPLHDDKGRPVEVIEAPSAAKRATSG